MRALCLLLAVAAIVSAQDPQPPDFSHAGYHAGDAPIPDVPVVANVRDFGAVGDGVTDDTAAFNRAVATKRPGAVLVPAGRYCITDFVTIRDSGVVLRGDGATKSVLWFPRTLTDVKPVWTANISGLRTSNYSWAGGFLVLGGPELTAVATAITQPAVRGDTRIEVAEVGDFAIGQDLEVGIDDDAARTLTNFLYAGDAGSITSLKPLRCRQLLRITSISGKTLSLDRPLRYDLRPEWQPKAKPWTPGVRESGIEDLGLAFPATPYAGHFTELGFNGIEVRKGAGDCWVRRIVVTNAESGIYVHGDRCTVTGFELGGDKPPSVAKYGGEKCIGHHGIDLGGSDNLVSDFHFKVCYIHDLTVEGGRAAGNVFASGSGVNLSLDHHKKAPHNNLFTDLDCGLGTRVWLNGGGLNLGKPSGTWETVWNLRATKPIPPPPAEWGPRGIIITGLTTPVEPRDLHAAQLAARHAH
jgi:hypothetical protein